MTTRLDAMPRAAIRRPTLRQVRLATGLVLFAYVTSHLANHALGNVSLDAMEAALDRIAAFWGLRPAAAALYGSLLVHTGLGLYALYDRPRYAWRASEASQMVLGLLLPFLLVAHVIGTKVARALFGTVQGYQQLLYVFWVESPGEGVLQSAALVAAWLHGCFGLYLWLRLKPGFARWSPILLCGAVLIPVLSLLGFVQGGRAVTALSTDEAWRIENLPAIAADSTVIAAQIETLGRIRLVVMGGFVAGIAAALLGRALRRLAERRRGLIRIAYPGGLSVRAPKGATLLEASRLAGIPHASVCGGRGRCSTCRVRVFGEGVAALPPASPGEQAVLDRVAAGPHVRLACQLRPSADLGIVPLIAPENAAAAIRHSGAGFGEERFVVAMFVDLRGSTRLAERHLPFDTVFLINRFLDAVARAVRREGGSPNQFLGDGMLALFGLQSDAADAARGALRAVGAIEAEVAALNLSMKNEAPLRFGIGLHAGTAILGEIGGHDAGHSVFTAIGDPVNVAARLQAMTKRLGAEAVISDAVYAAAGEDPECDLQEVAIDGREGAIRVVARRGEPASVTTPPG